MRRSHPARVTSGLRGNGVVRRRRPLGHILLVVGVVLAGGVALLGNRNATPAEVRGAPLDPGRSDPAGSAAPVSAATGSAAPVASPARALAELVDLDQILDQRTLDAEGAHVTMKLKDGRRAILTLDPALQILAEQLLTEARARRGAIVVMAPDGRILALAGRRSDPESAERTKARKADARKAASAAAAVFDWRLATDVWAPAASVFKLVTASALVAAGVGPDDKVCFHGGLRSVLASNLRDDRSDSRCESLIYGVAHSNNAILGKLAYQKLQPEQLSQVARELGLAAALPGELPGTAGVIDIPATHDLGFAQIAAGFAGSQLSAVGGALLAATFADDGEQPIPRIVASIEGTDVPTPARRRAVTSDIAHAVARMMQGTCEFGSAARSFGKRRPIRVAGKTGTLARTAPFYMEHSWFVGYAPADQPQIIVSVVLGNPENWHLRGHEAARRLIDRALDLSTHRDRRASRRATGAATSVKTIAQRR